MQRTVMLEPDQELELRSGAVIGVVSRETVLQALADMEAVIHVAGGGFTLISQRAETGVPGERVTTGVMLQWQDRTNARPQPEQDAELYERPAPPVSDNGLVAMLDGQRIALTSEDLEAVLAARAARDAPAAPPAAPVLSPDEAMRALEEGIPQAPPAIHPDEPHDPDAEDLSAIPAEAR